MSVSAALVLLHVKGLMIDQGGYAPNASTTINGLYAAVTSTITEFITRCNTEVTPACLLLPALDGHDINGFDRCQYQ
jgi:hypothetical protein